MDKRKIYLGLKGLNWIGVPLVTRNVQSQKKE